MAIIAAPIGSEVRFVWNGEKLTRRMNEAVRLGLEQVAAEMVLTAQELVHHPGDSQGYATGELQSDIAARVPNRRGHEWTIVFGSFNVGHAFWQEVLPEPTGRPYIRPAVAAHIDDLLAHIDANYGEYTDGDVTNTMRGYDQVGLTSANVGKKMRGKIGGRGIAKDTVSRWMDRRNEALMVRRGLPLGRTALGKRGTVPPDPFRSRGGRR